MHVWAVVVLAVLKTLAGWLAAALVAQAIDRLARWRP